MVHYQPTMKSSLSPRPSSSSSPATSSSMPSVSNINSEHSQNDDDEDGQEIITSQRQKIIGRTNISHEDHPRDRPHAPVANTLEHDDKRPHAPVAKLLLHENEKQQQTPQQSKGSSMIPNLLHSGAFPPPPPHSPNRHSSSSLPSSSPPTIISSPNMTSPHIPAAPPTTPYTPFATATTTTEGGGGERFVPKVPSFSAATASLLSAPNLNVRVRSTSSSPPPTTAAPSPPPLFHPSTSTTTTTNNNGACTITSLLNQQPFIDPHTNHLLHQTLLQTQSAEQDRIHQLTTHESQHYTTTDEYRHALARERRHSLSLSIELSHYKFLTKYQSCSLYSNLEMNEEARMNKVFKNIDDMKRNLKEDKIRCVMELEREEEGIVNGLMGRLEDVRREKMMLERQVYNSATTTSGGVGVRFGVGVGGGDEFEHMMSMMERHQQQSQQQGQVPSLVGPFGRMDMEVSVTEATAPSSSNTGEETNNDGSSSATTRPIPPTPSAIDVFPCLKEDEASEEGEEEEDEENSNDDDDILEGRYHDAEMEEELEKMLKMKESKK